MIPFSKFEVNITHGQFDALKRRYPGQAAQLEEIVHYYGPKAVINLGDITPQVREKLGTPLSDRLYRLAYCFLEERFFSYYHQVNEILNLPKSKVYDILEVGSGHGIFENLIRNYDYNLITLDINPDFSPDYVGDVRDIPLESKVVDLVCAFEVLQHLPYKYFTQAIKEMSRVARHYLYFSLPCQSSSVYFRFTAQFRQRFLERFSFDFNLFQVLLSKRIPDRDEARFLNRPDKHNPHYWEVGRRSYPKKRILTKLESCGLNVLKQFHNPIHPYHYFIICEID